MCVPSARERAPARVYTLLFPRLSFSHDLSVPPTLSLSICTKSSFSCSFPPRRSSYPSLASLVFNTSVCRPLARGCVRALACACVAPVMCAEERPCARKRERIRGRERARMSEYICGRLYACVSRVRMHLSMYTSVRLASCRAVRACASRVGEGIVTEMLTSWNHFLLSVAKFIGTSRREERGFNPAPAPR